MSNHQRDDELATLLRRALHEQAGTVTPAGDGLARIRQRTARRDARGWTRWAVAAGAAVVVAAVAVGAGVVLTHRGPARGGVVAAGPTTSAGPTGATTRSTSSGSTPATSSGSTGPTSSAVAPVQVAVPVYWLGQEGTRWRLYREFRAGPGPLDPAAAAQAAVDLALAGHPADPDYSSPWPSGSAAKVSLHAGEIRIDLDPAAARGRMDSQLARLAVQQLVWTATAAIGRSLPVRITVDGASPDLFGSVSLAEPFTRAAPPYDVLAAIWVLGPAEGQTVHGQVTARGVATVFEANLRWQLVRGGSVVRTGFTTASVGAPGRGDWRVDLGTLAPGRYTFRAYAESMQGDGSVVGEDTKTFTVR